MTKDEALRMALEALKWCHGGEPCGTAEAITAIKEALAQPEQDQLKPVWGGGPTNKDYEDAMRIKGLIQFVTPPQRTWVGLRDDEIYSVLENLQIMHHRPPTTDSRVIFARAIEAKLRSKNT